MRPNVTADATYRKRYLELLQEHTPALRRLCKSYCEARPEAEDLFQEIALALWTALARFRGESTDRTWLYRIAHNTALTFTARKRQRIRREQPVESGMDVPGVDGSPEHQLADSQRRHTLQLLVRELPFEDRRLVLLYLEGLPAADIGTITGSNPKQRHGAAVENSAEVVR